MSGIIRRMSPHRMLPAITDDLKRTDRQRAVKKHLLHWKNKKKMILKIKRYAKENI